MVRINSNALFFTESRPRVYVSLLEFRPENVALCIMLLFSRSPGAGRKLASADGTYPVLAPENSVATLTGGWAPGRSRGEKPGVCASDPKGSDLVVQIHYHPSGKPEQDQSSLA